MQVDQDDYLVGIGSNLDYPVRQVQRAISCISLFASVTEFRVSSLYRTAAWGGIEQPDYINAVIAVRGRLDPFDILASLQAVEDSAGRKRSGERWSARVLDLDLLMAGRQVISTSNLNVPHPRLQERLFVLLPIAEIAPKLTIPEHGSVDELIRNCPDTERIQQLDANEISYLKTFRELQ